jgi:hypothetical protein
VPHGIGRLRMTRATAALLAALAGFAVFAPTLGYEFVWDDRATVVHNRAIRSLANAPSFFTGHAFSGASEDLRDIRVIEYYRPVWVLSLAVNHAVWGERPLGYHLSNVLLHALASGLTAWLVFELTGGAGGRRAGGPAVRGAPGPRRGGGLGLGAERAAAVRVRTVGVPFVLAHAAGDGAGRCALRRRAGPGVARRRGVRRVLRGRAPVEGDRRAVPGAGRPL